jgi:hypothetical protein
MIEDHGGPPYFAPSDDAYERTAVEPLPSWWGDLHAPQAGNLRKPHGISAASGHVGVAGDRQSLKDQFARFRSLSDSERVNN